MIFSTIQGDFTAEYHRFLNRIHCSREDILAHLAKLKSSLTWVDDSLPFRVSGFWRHELASGYDSSW